MSAETPSPQPESELTPGQERYRADVAETYDHLTGNERQQYFDRRRNQDIKDGLVDQDHEDALRINTIRDAEAAVRANDPASPERIQADAAEFAHNVLDGEEQFPERVADVDQAHEEAMGLYAEAADIEEAKALDKLRSTILRNQTGDKNDWTEPEIIEAAEYVMTEARRHGPSADALEQAVEYAKGLEDTQPPERRSLGEWFREKVLRESVREAAPETAETTPEAEPKSETAPDEAEVKAEAAAEKAAEAEAAEAKQAAAAVKKQHQSWLEKAWENAKQNFKEYAKQKAAITAGRLKRAGIRLGKIAAVGGAIGGGFLVGGAVGLATLPIIGLMAGGYAGYRILGRPFK